MTRPVLFLDFDDVICLNQTFGGYDALHAIAQVEKSPGLPAETFNDIWAELFDINAKTYLRAIHDIYDPWFVLSTSWCRVIKKNPLVEILNRTGLNFVTENLHSSWATPRRMSSDIRAGEICSWLRGNPGFENAWVVLDDEVSGVGLSDWLIPDEQSFIVLCKENIGITEVEYKKLRTAFQLRGYSSILKGKDESGSTH